jgi:hypothetical protein
MRLRGAPRRLEGVVSLPAGANEVEVEVKGLTVESISARPLGDPGAPERWLRLALPRLTPPGDYRGTLRAGGHEEQIALHVEPRIRLRLSPRGLILSGQAGERVAATVLVANLGNARCAIREVNAVGLFDVEGAERAVGRTFRRKDGDGGRIIERLAEELEEGYGGLARLTVAEGAGDLVPGEARELALTLQLPDELHPGRVYEGAWTLPEVNYMVRVEVAEGKPTRKEAR